MADVSTPASIKTVARQQQILDAACDCVRRAGFHGASMADIAHAAGLSVGQIYRYFENKEAIVAAIVAKDLADMRAKFAEFETSGEDVSEAILKGCSEGLDRHFDPDRAALVLEVLAEAARNPRVAAIVQDADAVERALGDSLLRHVRELGCSDAEVKARGEMLSMIFDGMYTRAVNNPNADRKEIAIVLRSVLRHILLSPSFKTDEAD
jgi:AcrR family transcriptional regulator